MEALKVGVIGLGMMGEVHTQVYRTLPGVEIIGCVETDETRANVFSKKYSIPVYRTPDALFKQVDAVSLCTPDNMHKDFILRAFENNVRVLVEKPLEVSTAACEEIIKAMPDESYLMVGHILRFDARVWRAKQILDSGELGRILSVNVWRSNSRASGERIGDRCSVTWFLGIHDIDMVLWLLGGAKIKRVSAMGKKIFTRNYDYVVSTLETEDGVVILMENGWTMPVQRITGLDAGFKIIGETGMLEINLTHDDARVTSQLRGRSMLMDTYHWPEINGALNGDLRIEIEAFINAARAKAAPPVTAREAAKAVGVIERIERCLEER